MDHGSMTLDWACAFCSGSTGDDPRTTEIGIAFPSGDGPSQFFRAHFECLKGALHSDAAAELVDLPDA